MFDDIPKELRPFWINVHGCVGLVYFALVIARLVWRTSHKPPDLPPDIGEFDRRISLAAHHLLYVLMVLIPIFGIVAYVWHGRAFDYGFAQLNFGVASNPGVFHPAEEVHQVLAYCLFGLAALHAAAALYHHFVRATACFCVCSSAEGVGGRTGCTRVAIATAGYRARSALAERETGLRGAQTHDRRRCGSRATIRRSPWR